MELAHVSLPGAAVCFFQSEGFVTAPIAQTWAKQHLSLQPTLRARNVTSGGGGGPVGRQG